MSSRRSYYLGPYVETRCPMVSSARTAQGCTNTACEVHTQNLELAGLFCSNCGERRGPVTYHEQEPAVDAAEVYKILGEAMTDWRTDTDGVSAWTPNLTDRGEPRRFEVEPQGETGATPLDAEDLPDRERDWLRSAFAAELGVLTKAYGTENVRVRWGLVWMWT